jgi:hypothetical protein
MNMKELEEQCRVMSNIVDTEIVRGDPREISSFDAGTLYVWLVPESSGGNEGPVGTPHPSTPDPMMIVRGRFGEQDQIARSVPELAEKLGVLH